MITEDGKIIKDLGIAKRDYDYNLEPEPTGTLQLVKEEGIISMKRVPKAPTWEDILNKIPEPDPNRQSLQESKTEEIASSESQTNISKEDNTKELTSSEMNIPESQINVPELKPLDINIPESQINVPESQANISKQDNIPELKPLEINIPESKINLTNEENVPKPQEIDLQISKPTEIKIPKLQINIPKEPPKLQNVPNKIATAYPKSKKVEQKVGTVTHKADEVIKSQQFGITKDKITTNNKIPQITKEKRRSMVEELEAELLNERKFEEWIKKQKFRENLEKAAKFAEETKEQFEEKIPELSGKIENVTGEVRNVENKLGAVDDRLGTVDKSIGTLCTGIDCMKEDVKKYQTSHDALEKMVQERFKDLGEKVQGLENPMFTCENCGEQKIRPLDSYCPNCGSPIHSWSDEEGQPIRGWSPYWKRMGKAVQE